MDSCLNSLLPLNLIPLQHAVLCANCEVISESKNGHCLVCGSPSLINLSRVLGRSTAEEERFLPFEEPCLRLLEEVA